MECRIEHADHGNARHNSLTSPYADNVCGLMKGRKLGKLFDRLHHVFRKKDGIVEHFAAVDYSVTDRVDFLHRRNGSVFFIDKRVEYNLNSLLMSGHRRLYHRFFTVDFMFAERTVKTDSFATALCDCFFGCHIYKLIFKR